MITIPGCDAQDVEIILKTDPFRDWIRDVHAITMQILAHMILPRDNDNRTIERVQHVSMHIWRHANKLNIKTDGQLMNAQWSDEYFTICIPLIGSFGTIRFERDHANRLKVHLAFPDCVEFMSHLGFSELAGHQVEYSGINMTVKHVAFLIWCEHMRTGLSAPFKDMIQDGEL